MVESQGYKRFFPFNRILKKRRFLNYPGTKAFLESDSFSGFIRNENLIKLAPGFAPQTQWVVDENNQRIVDFIGKYEDLENDFNSILKEIGLQQINLTIHNKSKKKENKKIKIEKDDLDFLYHRFKNDFDLFEYNSDVDIYLKSNTYFA